MTTINEQVVPLFSYPCLYLFVCLFDLPTLTGMKLIIKIDLIYDSQMTKDVVYFKNVSQVVVVL